MARWFRSHASKLNNPKVQRLSDALYRGWDSLLCVACEFGGKLPPVVDVAFLLRKSEEQTAKLINALIERGLFVKTETGIEPHEWNEWQYKSDVSTERVKRFREQQRNVSETSSESEADTETERTPAKAGESAQARPPTKRRGTRISPCWRPDDAGRSFAGERGLDPDSTADAFADYWTSATGRTSTKLDWNAAFRTWCRRDADKPQGRGGGGAVRPARGNDSVFERLASIASRDPDEFKVR